ncbi:chromosome condensation regulator, partial [Clostridioides difficile]|nr:chromosome condensation regulator [Clostridioides difficile]
SNINSGPITSDKAIFLYKALLYLSSNTLYGFGNISESAKELDVSDTQDGYNATNYKKVMKNIKNIFIPPYDLSRDKTRFAILTDKSLFICGYNSKGTHGISVNSSLNLNNKINYNKKNSSSEISSNIQEIYSHSKSTYLLTNNNMLYSVGLNDVGQLGVGDEINRKVFTKINIDNIKSINVNRFTDNSKHVFAIKNDNTCYAVGLNNSGQLGIGDNVNRNVFTKINVENVKYVAVYGNTSLLLTNDGLLYGAGNNGKGQLGLGDTTSRNIFTRIPINGVRDVYICNDVSIIVKNDNTCYVCGFVNGYFGFTEGSISTFTKINIENVKSVVTAGSEATFFITNDNVIYTTGKKERVFFSTETNDIKGIRVINNIINAKKIVVNGYTSAILTNDNKLFVGGLSGYGSIANNNNTNSVEDVKDVFVTANNTLYIDNNNNLISSGRDTYGISDESYRDMSVPYYKVSIKKDVDTVFSSYNTIFIKDIYGKFYSSTGDNRYNHLGIHHRYDNDKNEALEGSLHSYFKTDNTSDKIVFNKKNEKLVMFNDKYIKTNNKYINYKNIFKDNFKYTSIILPFEVSDIDISKTHSLAVAKDGKLYGIGSNSYKEINQTLEDIELLTLTEVNISDVKKVACGDNYSYIIKTDNTLWSYGKNTEYQLGVGHNNDVRELQKVTGLPSVKDISIYNSMTLVLTNEGELYAQGYNTNGLFGLGESEKDKIIRTFTKVLTNVKEIKSHNDDHILVIKNDNSLWITGKNKSMYKISISITDLYEFTKIPIPEHLNDILDIELSDDTIYMITKVDTSKASIEIVEKSISQVRVVVQDPNNVIEKLEMFINDELISTKTNLEINSIIFEIPQNKIVLGENKILIKASSPTGDLYSSMFIFKSETGLKVKKDSILMINNKVYSIINITENNTDLIVTLNEGLKDDMMENNPIYQLINKTKVQVKINKSDLFKDMKLVEIKKSDSSYQEIYELEEANIKSAQPKIIVEKGDKWTAIKRPSMIFRYDAESNEPQA